MAVVEIPPGTELQGDTGIIGRLDTTSHPLADIAPGPRDDALIPVVDLKGENLDSPDGQDPVNFPCPTCADFIR